MGNFNFECGNCGWGPGGDGEDGRDYFGKPAQVFATTRSGKEVRMNGHYTGYGEVELPGGQTFFLKQFEEYWAGWISHKPTDATTGPFVGGAILCEDCCSAPTPMTEFALSDFQTVKEYLEKRAAAASAPAPAAPPAVSAKPAPKAKATAKPKALTKEQLAAKVAELEAEVARLKPMEQRLKDLDKAYTRLQQSAQVADKKLAKIQRALYGYDD